MATETQDDKFGDYTIVTSKSDAAPVSDTPKEMVKQEKKGFVPKKMDAPPTEFKDGAPYYAHWVPERYGGYREGDEYRRDWEITPHDKLMNELIKNFAREGRDKETGRPNGRFFIDREGAKKAFKPFEGQYLKLKEAMKLDDFYKNEFEQQF